ncbi:hypothetical protein B8W90_11775, partial [Staphylococcus hominis]
DRREADQRAEGLRAHMVHPVRIQVGDEGQPDAGHGSDDDVGAAPGARHQQHRHHVQHCYRTFQRGEHIDQEDPQREQRGSGAEHGAAAQRGCRGGVRARGSRAGH